MSECQTSSETHTLLSSTRMPSTLLCSSRIPITLLFSSRMPSPLPHAFHLFFSQSQVFPLRSSRSKALMKLWSVHKDEEEERKKWKNRAAHKEEERKRG